MLRVEHLFTEFDTEDTCEGKFEAVLSVVCRCGHRSDVIPVSDGYHRVVVLYDESERAALEPLVQSIMQNTDGTFWDVTDTYTTNNPR